MLHNISLAARAARACARSRRSHLRVIARPIRRHLMRCGAVARVFLSASRLSAQPRVAEDLV